MRRATRIWLLNDMAQKGITFSFSSLIKGTQAIILGEAKVTFYFLEASTITVLSPALVLW